MTRGSTKVIHNRLPQLAQEQRAAVAAAIGATTLDLEGEIKQTIVAVGAVDTGLMLNSTQGSHDAGSLSGSVSTAAEYWPHVNYGTSRMPARPFVEPAVDTVKPRHDQRIKDALS